MRWSQALIHLAMVFSFSSTGFAEIAQPTQVHPEQAGAQHTPQQIQEAKELPKIGNIYSQEYPSKPEGYNWPRSYEQYKDNVEDLQVDLDEALDRIEELEEEVKELQKIVNDLRVQVANKRDK